MSDASAPVPAGISTPMVPAEYLLRVAEVGEVVRRAAAPLARGREVEQRDRLADEVEGDVGERDVLLEDGRVPAPLGEAVPQHQPVVGEAQQVLGGRPCTVRLRRRALHGRAHSPFTPMGTL